MATIDIKPKNVIKEVSLSFNRGKIEEIKRRIREHQEGQEKPVSESK